MEFSLGLRKATEARHVLVVALNVGLKRPLHEAAKLKPSLPWRSQDVKDARTMDYPLRRAAIREWK